MGTTKVTYVNLTADNQELHGKLDAAVTRVRSALGGKTPLVIGGKERFTDKTITSTSPTDTKVVVANAASATPADVQDAVAAAKAAWPAWRRMPWQERAALVDKAAAWVRDNVHDLAVWLMVENGKNRVEAMGEIEEVADLYLYYTAQMRANDGFVHAMDKLSPADRNTSVLRPYGVWVVVSPWNYPYALLGAPAAAALVAGNTVVLKPSSDTPMAGYKILEAFQKAGLPPGVVNLVSGSGSVAGDALVMHPDVAGVTFTGSYDVGFHKLYRRFSTDYPKPCIVEMGGKNPAIVMDSADLDRAVMGVYRSAFGMGGQKCSACSRVYVHEAIADEFTARLQKMAEETKIGDAVARDTFLGPVGTRSGYEDYQRFADLARKDGRVVTGGKRLTEGAFGAGLFVQPTVFTGLPEDHALVKEELFLPMLYLGRIKSLDEGLAKANDTKLGLTAGFFSRKQTEIDEFLDRIEAGVVYVNRAAGATTGAWPGVQPFGGWKGSGSTGKNIGGLYTVQCYLREQSRTVTE